MQQILSKLYGRRFTRAARRKAPVADMDQAVQKGSSGHHYGPCADLAAVHKSCTDNGLPVCEQLCDLALAESESGDRLELVPHLAPVERSISLGARRLHCRSTASIEHPELDAGLIDDPSHKTAQRVDLADEMALGNSTDRWIARHLSDQVEAQRDQGSSGSDSG